MNIEVGDIVKYKTYDQEYEVIFREGDKIRLRGSVVEVVGTYDVKDFKKVSGVDYRNVVL